MKNRFAPNDVDDENDDFIRDYFGVDVRSHSVVPDSTTASKAKLLDPRFEERRRWATSTLAVFGIAALAGAFFAIAGARWNLWTQNVKAIFLIAAFASAHLGAFFVERRSAPLLAHFLYCLGTATFVGGVFALFLGDDPARSFALRADALPPTALLVFATAQTRRSRSLHFCATATLVAAFALDDGSRQIFAVRFADWAFACCALGEYWAWRRKSLSVATVYFGVGLWALGDIILAPFSLGVRPLVLLCVFGLFQRWFGAAFRSAFGATLGVFVALCSLGLAAFPYFWEATFATNDVELFGWGTATSAAFPAVLCAALFVVFSTRLIFDGARQNVVQFGIAIAVFALWLIAQCVDAGRQLETNRAAIAPAATAAVVFASLLLKIRSERDDAPIAGAEARSPREPVLSDALDDDQDLDDLFDADARAGRQTPRLSPVSESLDALWANAERRCRFPIYVASTLAQALALLDFANPAWRLF